MKQTEQSPILDTRYHLATFPPKLGDFSIRYTLIPARERFKAKDIPAIPPPSIAQLFSTSTVLIIIFFWSLIRSTAASMINWAFLNANKGSYCLSFE